MEHKKRFCKYLKQIVVMSNGDLVVRPLIVPVHTGVVEVLVHE